MKLTTTTLVLGVALAVVAGLFSSTIFGLTGTKANVNSIDSNTSAMMTGHVITTVTDADGNIKAYRQSDNLIVNNGENCVLKMLFGASGGTSVGTGTNTCTGAITSGFRVIAIGNNTSVAGNTNSTLGADYTSSSISGLQRKTATTITLTNSTATTGVSQATAVLAATFTNNGSSGQQVTESGLFNSTSTAADGLFARQQFSAVTLNNGDQITVQWTVNIGGTSTIDQSGP